MFKNEMKKIFIMVVVLGILGVLFVVVNSVVVVEVQGNVVVVENKVVMCIGCYVIFDYKMLFFEVYCVFYFGGQNVKYIESVLYVYQKGDCKYLIMCVIVGFLIDQDIVNFVVYYLQQMVVIQNNFQK